MPGLTALICIMHFGCSAFHNMCMKSAARAGVQLHCSTYLMSCLVIGLVALMASCAGEVLFLPSFAFWFRPPGRFDLAVLACGPTVHATMTTTNLFWPLLFPAAACRTVRSRRWDFLHHWSQSRRSHTVCVYSVPCGRRSIVAAGSRTARPSSEVSPRSGPRSQLRLLSGPV